MSADLGQSVARPTIVVEPVQPSPWIAWVLQNTTTITWVKP